jgi:hypothetical protein
VYDRLQRWVETGDPFAAWVVRSPELRERVEICLMRVDRANASPCEDDLLSGRDAAWRLQAIAFDGGFFRDACLFLEWYESYCRALLRYWS